MRSTKKSDLLRRWAFVGTLIVHLPVWNVVPRFAVQDAAARTIAQRNAKLLIGNGTKSTASNFPACNLRLILAHDVIVSVSAVDRIRAN